MKYNVIADDKIVNKTGPVSLDQATEMVKMITGRMTIGARLAADQGNEQLRLKNLATRDSVKIVEVTDGQ